MRMPRLFRSRPAEQRFEAAKPAGRDRQAGDRQMRNRLMLAMVAFSAIYLVIGGRLMMLATMTPESRVVYLDPGQQVSHARPDILDRAGNVLATDINVPSVYAEPTKIIDVDETIEDITSVFPELDAGDLRAKLTSGKQFVWVKREITPTQKSSLFGLGIAGVGFLEENKRVYPAGAITSHVLGYVNIDNQGIAGFEKYLDSSWLGALHEAGLARNAALEPVKLTIDLRAQHAMRDELLASMDKFKATAAAGAIMDVHTGELVALVSLPDFDPERPAEALQPDRINRMTTGVYELGSAFKAFTTAMALDTGRIGVNTTFDARSPIRVGRNTIGDYHAQNRIMTVEDIYIHSSNIGTARMALAVGVPGHQAFLKKLGFFERLTTELPESGAPIIPQRWKEVNTMTIAFGHGMSIAPLQAVEAGAALVNGGQLIPPTFLPRSAADARKLARRVIEPQTSDKMRYLMRLNVVEGTAKKADVPGYHVGGKTGTAEKVVNGRYSGNKVLTTFLSTFPTTDPKYLVFVMLDEPQGIKETHGYRTSGWNVAPTARNIIARIAPILGVVPDMAPADPNELLSVSY
ncbi:peptidoglycan D,D-transpeptidase FtsI family protein [Microbaculum sp. FT89]|uniref:peptidoglycan D,D-transpeptidase FtsI family protein n=1 Tax=Microbaculum sp. FT89 TaxID=3447298 RepID=UPI003F52D78A